MKNRYSVSEFITNAYALLITKVFYRGARLVRRPVYIRGRSSLDFGHGLTLGHCCRFDLPGNRKTLFIGERCELGDYTHIVAHEKVKIGKKVLMASKIFISDTNHGVYKGENADSPEVAPNERKLSTSPVIIGDNVWIGENVVILAGSEIGNGCIIGANAVVTGKFDDNCIIAGVPAKVIKRWNRLTAEWEKEK